MEISKEVQYLTRKPITSVVDIHEFLYDLLTLHSLNFHPDNDFNEYVNYETGERLFNDSECVALDKTLAECHEHCQKVGVDIYRFMLGIFVNFQNISE